MSQNGSSLRKDVGLLYLSPRDLLKVRSDPIHIMASAKGFARVGADVEVLAPSYSRPENISEDRIHSAYNLDRDSRIEVTHLATELTDNSAATRVRMQKIIAFGKKAFELFFKTKEFRNFREYIIYSKCIISTLPYIIFLKIWKVGNVRIAFEAVSYQGGFFERFVLRAVDKVIAINPYLKEDIQSALRIASDNILVPRIGFDDGFNHVFDLSREQARETLGLDVNEKIALYSGKVVGGLNTEVAKIIEAAAHTPDITYIFTGGKPDVIEFFEDLLAARGIDNVRFTGFFESIEIPLLYMRAANALVSFYPPDVPTIRYMVPNKIVQYARSKTVVVSAYYPAIEFMLGEDGAVYVEPGDVLALANNVRNIIGDESRAHAIAENAHRRMKDQSISDRASEIIGFVTAGQSGSSPH